LNQIPTSLMISVISRDVLILMSPHTILFVSGPHSRDVLRDSA
jgi:hypothetical protein